MVDVLIRKAIPTDVQSIFDLIKELAIYEKAENELVNTPEQLLKDGFGDNPIFDCFVAEIDNQIVGIALLYVRYSTWKGSCWYLEDLIVKEDFRRFGFGSKLMEIIIKTAKERKYPRVQWQVLNWNELAINFYKKYKPFIDKEWWNVIIEV